MTVRSRAVRFSGISLFVLPLLPSWLPVTVGRGGGHVRFGCSEALPAAAHKQRWAGDRVLSRKYDLGHESIVNPTKVRVIIQAMRKRGYVFGDKMGLNNICIPLKL